MNRLSLCALTILAAMLSFGCKTTSENKRQNRKTGNEQAATAGEFRSIVNASELEPGAITPLDAAKLVETINKEDTFLAKRTGPGTCQNEMKKFTVKGNDKFIYVEGDADLTACFKESFYEKASFKFLNQFSCEAGGLTSLLGKSSDEFEFSNLCRTSTAKVMNSSRTTIVARYEVDGKSYSATSEIFHARNGPDQSPCMRQAESKTITHCEETTLTHMSAFTSEDGSQLPNQSPFNSYRKFSYVNIIRDDDLTAPYYKSGSIQFTIEDWQGTMTYNGSHTAPTWTATRGLESKSGTFAPTTP